MVASWFFAGRLRRFDRFRERAMVGNPSFGLFSQQQPRASHTEKGQLVRVQASKAPYSTEEYAPAARMILASYIIEAAKAGERDPRWLADSAFLYLLQQRTRDGIP
jgi:hypothetical protein